MSAVDEREQQLAAAVGEERVLKLRAEKGNCAEEIVGETAKEHNRTEARDGQANKQRAQWEIIRFIGEGAGFDREIEGTDRQTV